MKKKILFVITQFYKGGAETSLLRLFEMLDEKKYDVDFLVLNQIEYADATSLMGDIPSWIKVMDALKVNSKYSAFDKIKGKIYRRIFHTETFGKSAVDFVKGKRYDAAISFGEWLSPAFIVKEVRAKSKYVWIHIDLDKADFVNRKELVKYNKAISAYIFASETSMKSSVQKCPEMQGKSVVIHNFLNKENIIKRAEENCDVKISGPYLLSVGNLRVEKNYPRQVETMHLLKLRNLPLKWLCVGSTVDKRVYGEVADLIEKYNLQDDFILCGADNNPYKYMKNATAVMVLSDYESWSLVISEAKILGIPVIATDTSGAREQLVDGRTGIIATFDSAKIADTIEHFVKDLKLQEYIRSNLVEENIVQSGLSEFESLLEN